MTNPRNALAAVAALALTALLGGGCIMQSSEEPVADQAIDRSAILNSGKCPSGQFVIGQYVSYTGGMATNDLAVCCESGAGELEEVEVIPAEWGGFGNYVVSGTNLSDGIVTTTTSRSCRGEDGRMFIVRPIPADWRGGLTVRAGDGNDQIEIELPVGSQMFVYLYGGRGNDVMILHAPTTVQGFFFLGSGVDQAIGGDGDDWFGFDPDFMPQSYGGDHSSTSICFGGYGNDSFSFLGSLGTEEIWGGLGNDWGHLSLGDDFFNGEDGHDYVDGGDGYDTCAAEEIHSCEGWIETDVCGDGFCAPSEEGVCYSDCPECGDGVCDETEDCFVCAADCGTCSPWCGDGSCSGDEDCIFCPVDCGACAPPTPVCGNGACEEGEDCAWCPDDCRCSCGDGTCSALDAETCLTCPLDCSACPSVCGDGECADDESSDSCPADCPDPGSVCGDGACDPDESCISCPADCGECGPVVESSVFDLAACASRTTALGRLHDDPLGENRMAVCCRIGEDVWNLTGIVAMRPGSPNAELTGNAEADFVTFIGDDEGTITCDGWTVGGTAPIWVAQLGIVIRGGDGDDIIDLNGLMSSSCSIHGEAGRDTLTGGLSGCELDGGTEDDMLFAGPSGHDSCDGGEGEDFCSDDCATQEGCEPAGPICGDGDCTDDENCESCPADCGVCPLFCGDGICSPERGEWCRICPRDCGICESCGDGICNGDDDCESCFEDCGGGCVLSCGDGYCLGDETCEDCPADCGACG